jgi:lipopolysaccharide transport system ATP-binding protein
MTMRLAFSVAAHLEPEIMIVDEVLAVGDIDFQKKCLGKMKEVAGSGRTVLFVSHNMNAVRQLCDRVIWLANGQVKLDTRNVDDAIEAYAVAAPSSGQWQMSGPIDCESFTVHEFHTYFGTSMVPRTKFSNADEIGVLIDVDVRRFNPLLNFGIQLNDKAGTELFFSLSTDGAQQDWPIAGPGRHKLYTCLPSRLLNGGEYTLRLIASLHNERWILDPQTSRVALTFTVEQTSLPSPYWRARRPGLLAPQLAWRAI